MIDHSSFSKFFEIYSNMDSIDPYEFTVINLPCDS